MGATCGFRPRENQEEGMSKIQKKIWPCLVLFALSSAAFAQKIKVGYDKSVDFSHYKTYTWAEPSMPPTRPMLYSTVVASVDDNLKNNGLQRVDKNGDLTLNPAGGIEYGISSAAGTPMLATYGGPPRLSTQACGPAEAEPRTLQVLTFQKGPCNCSSSTAAPTRSSGMGWFQKS